MMRRLQKGIRRDRYGYRVYAKVGGRQKEVRMPPDTTMKQLVAKRDEIKVALRAGKAPTQRDTLRADAVKYLQQQKPRLVKATYASRVCEINAWVDTFGDVPRHKITREMVLEARHRWRTTARGGKGRDVDKPRAPKTCNHRVRALQHLYRYLDGRATPTPCDDIPKLKEPDADPQFVTTRTIKRVATKLLHDPPTRGRFMVLAATGQRPAQLKRAVPADVNLRRGVWRVKPAKGGQAIPVILTDDMIAAFKVFAAAEAWGHFDGSDYAKRLYAAGWPKHIRPYNTKHTVAITLGESEAEWEDIKDWFGHKDVKSTRIYTGLILKRFKRTGARLAGRIGW